MTELPPEPEMWISDGPEGPDGGPPPRGAPRGPGRGWGRWIAIVAGFAVLLALVSVQHFLGGTGGHSAEPTTGVPVTPPPTTSRSETPRTDMTDSSTVATSGHFDDHGPDSGMVTTGALHGGPAPITTMPGTTEPAPTAPVTETVSSSPLAAGQDWELVGFQWSANIGDGPAVITYRPSTGALVTTPVPALNSNGSLSFVVTAHAAIIRPMDYVPGYVVPDGRPAQFAQAHLDVAGPVFPSPNPDSVWAFASRGNGIWFDLVGTSGAARNMPITVPESLGIMGGWMFTTDGAGYVLAAAVGGTYDLRPSGARLVTHGKVLAAGSKNYLVYECDEKAQCGAAVLDRATGHRTPLPRYTPPASMLGSPVQGVISPNGRYVALLDYAPDGTRFDLVDLRTGTPTAINVSPSSGAPLYGDATPILAFTPDSSILLIAAAGGVFPIDVTTGVKLSPLPIPPLAAIAIRPAS